jgi:phage baseplate assembly protein gpV
VTHSLFETIQRIVQQELAQIRTAEVGIVREQFPHAADGDADNYACSVELRNSGLALKRVPVATPQIGQVAIPAVGDLVLVQFIGGDIQAPVITGRLYSDEARPPVNDDGRSVLHLPLGAQDDDAVHVELQSGDTRQIELRLGKTLKIDLADDDPVLAIDVDGGKAKVTIGRDGAVTIESQGDLAFKGGQINVEAQGKLTLKGATVDIN